MRNRKTRYDLILLMPIFYAFVAFGVAKLMENSGIYTGGIDTLCHLYKGDLLFQAIREGDFWPIYDSLWYNGVENMRYCGPLPMYLLAACEFFGGKDPMSGFPVFVSFLYFAGAMAWFFVGVKVKRPLFGALLGGLWFFMPDNLYTLFYKGDLPRAICSVLLPLLLYWVYDYLQEKHWYTVPKLSVCFALMALCHPGYAGTILLACLMYLILHSMIRPTWKQSIQILGALLFGYLLIGVWLLPALTGAGTSMETSELLANFFQSIFLSINPFARIQRGCTDVYFGLASLLLAIFGGFLSKRKSMPGFWTGIVILACTSNMMYLLLSSLPGVQSIQMFHFISIALCMILFSFLIWDTLKKGWILLFAGLLILDVLPSLPLIVGNQSGKTPNEVMADFSRQTLIGEAKQATQQRLALVDESPLDGANTYFLTGYDSPVATSHGAVWQSSSAIENFKQLHRSLAEGNYWYLFDRCLELGNDTVVVRLDMVHDLMKSPIQIMDRAAAAVGYRLAGYDDSYRFYKLDIQGNWGTVSKYRAIGIGTAAAAISRQFPIVEETERRNLNDFSFEELQSYDVVYLAGFTYDDKLAAEELLIKLSESGTRVVIAADGMPNDRDSQTQSFLGIVCNPVSFSQGYPNLDTIDGILDTDLFPDGYREWETVYVNGLDEVWGTVNDLEWDLPFYGTVKNENIVVYGLNLTYYLSLTRDEQVAKLLSRAMDLNPTELPKRELVPYKIQYLPDEIVIETDRDDVNSGLVLHDSFMSDQKIYEKNHFMYVHNGKTVISLTIPYWKQGAIVSIVSTFLIFLYTLVMRRRYKLEREAG